MLASVESMMPLHSAIASARLRSNIAVDSSCWSLLSEAVIFAFLEFQKMPLNVFCDLILAVLYEV
ncbi:unnamed protein product [Camellia sinensis]